MNKYRCAETRIIEAATGFPPPAQCPDMGLYYHEGAFYCDKHYAEKKRENSK